MARRPKQIFNDREIRALRTPGYHADGEGLYVQVGRTPDDPKAQPAKSWIFKFQWQKKTREMGLGPYPTIGLGAARALAAEAREDVLHGRDPIIARNGRRAQATAIEEPKPTFYVFGKGMVDQWQKGFKNKKHISQWYKTLEDYAAGLRDLPIDQVGIDDVLAVLRPLWDDTTDTATRVRGRIERILDAAAVKNLRPAENPARWKGKLKLLLTAPRKLKRGHHKAMPWQHVPAFMAKLRALESPSARALEFLILTVPRTMELCLGRQSEVDFDALIFTIPPERLKGTVDNPPPPHRIPLVPRAVEILRIYWTLTANGRHGPRNDPYLFPGGSEDGHLSNGAMSECLKGLDARGFTVHGFRSTFRDWCKEKQGVPRELAELCLAHRIGSETEQAYSRGDALEMRRDVMQAWAEFVYSAPVVLLREPPMAAAG